MKRRRKRKGKQTGGGETDREVERMKRETDKERERVKQEERQDGIKNNEKVKRK